jgi:hypothetical protein
MQDKKVLAAAALLGAVALVSTRAWASAPAGVWVKVQKVVYAPDATNPTHVQVHGALMLYEGNLDGGQPYPGYTSPAFGYMYYECPTGQAEVCRQEWSELEANIAKPVTECLGFGMTSLPTGALRQPASAVENPDVYPIQSGVSPGFSPCQAIAKFLAEHGAGGNGGAPSGGSSTGGAGSSTGGAGSSTGGAGSSSGGKPASNGGAASAGASTGATGEEPTSGSSTDTAGTGTGGRPGSEPDHLASGKPRTDDAADSKAAGCSVVSATGAASVLGLGAALGIFGLGLARRHRQRK